MLLLLGGSFLQAQPVVAPPQSESVLITGATAHLGNGAVIENAYVAFDEGKFTQVSASAINTNGYQVIDASGKHVYPGFIAPNTQIGLIEIGGVRATRDASEVGNLNPNIRSIIAYNTDSDIIPTARAVGVLLAQPTPTSGRIPGTSAIVQLDAWNWEDAAYKAEDGVHLDWPSRFRYPRWWLGETGYQKSDSYDEQTHELEKLFAEAKAYSQKSSPKQTNVKLEAMKGLFDGSRKLYIHANSAKDIMESALFAKRFGVSPVIVGGDEAWMVTDFLVENEVPIILDDTQRLPSRVDYDIDQPFKIAKQLEDAGVLYSFSMSGTWQIRNLPYQAGQAVGFGLDKEKAVQALTLNTAKIMGIADRTGSLEVGKDANLFISEGDALDMRTGIVTHAFIQGRAVDLSNKQKDLYERFQTKYSQD